MKGMIRSVDKNRTSIYFFDIVLRGIKERKRLPEDNHIFSFEKRTLGRFFFPFIQAEMQFNTKLICLSLVIFMLVLSSRISVNSYQIRRDGHLGESRQQLHDLARMLMGKRGDSCIPANKPCAYTSDNSVIGAKQNSGNTCCKGLTCRHYETILDTDDNEYYGSNGLFYYHMYSCQWKRKR